MYQVTALFNITFLEILSFRINMQFYVLYVPAALAAVFLYTQLDVNCLQTIMKCAKLRGLRLHTLMLKIALIETNYT